MKVLENVELPSRDEEPSDVETRPIEAEQRVEPDGST